jgi:hypothetical protein
MITAPLFIHGQQIGSSESTKPPHLDRWDLATLNGSLNGGHRATQPPSRIVNIPDFITGPAANASG